MKAKTFAGPAIYKGVSANGRAREKKVRRKKKKTFAELFRNIGNNEFNEGDNIPSVSFASTSSIPRPYVPYAERKKRAQKEWAEHREALQHALVENLHEDHDKCFVDSCQEPPIYRCLDCGCQIFYCGQHVRQYHQRKLHLPEKLKVKSSDKPVIYSNLK